MIRRFLSRIAGSRPSVKKSRNAIQWQIAALEPRMMLAADAGQAAIEAADGPVFNSGSVSDAGEANSVAAESAATEIVFIDGAVADTAMLLDGIDDRHEVVLLDPTRNGLDQISQVLESRSGLRGVHLIAHGQAGTLSLGNERVDVSTLRQHAEQIRSWAQALHSEADLLIYGCDTAAGDMGTQFIERLSKLTGADVAASTDTTGSRLRGADWDLEKQVGQIETGIVVSTRVQEAYQGVLPITIYAAGQRGEEQMQLLIDNQVVQTWDNVGGDASNRQFEAFTFDADGISADSVRVAFTNDLYQPEQGIDRNLIVDRIEIDGETFETEDPKVFSTGTWRSADGIVPGFRESEILAANGFFQYAEQDPPPSSDGSITIFAAGLTGEEQMQLLIDNVVVQTWDNVGGDASNRQFEAFTFNVDGVSADSVRVAFTNDLYLPEKGIDRDLIVDRIEIDGVVFESEDPSVFSSGTWLPADGLVAGFRESEVLNANGFFQYAEQELPTLDGAFAIINEIHYNPGPDGEIDGDAEFLELFNPGNEDFDLSGASFSGFDLVFAEGTILRAGQYAIVAPSISIAESEWGVTPLAEFADGGLSGGGELIQLIAADGVTIIDEVNYDDTSPWPGSPDGNGPSLELINPTFDKSAAANWRGSEGSPTPAAQNSVFATEPTPDITNIAVTPGTPLPGQAFTISATIPSATQATLTYKIGFGDDQLVEMVNTQGDVWEAVVPGQAAGSLVRYRIDSDVAMAPFEGDTINYLGVVVSPTDIVDNTLPVFQWYVDPADFEKLITEDLFTNNKIPTVIAYGDQVIDNAQVRVRGSSSRNFTKKGFKFEMPDGYLLDMAPLTNTPVDEFGLVPDFADETFTSAQIAWEVFNAETDSPVSSFHLRLEQNSDFYGVYRFQELYDGTWRTANGYDDGEFYQAEDGAWGVEDGFDKKEPDDDDDTLIMAAKEILEGPASAEKTQWVYDNVNIPAAINHMALTVLMRHGDQNFHNFYMALDGDTNRWEMLEWDLDLTWRSDYEVIPGAGLPFVTPEPIESIYLDAVWEIPEFREMYWQRLQTLVDRYLEDDRLIERREELLSAIGSTNGALDSEAWVRRDYVDSQSLRTEWQESIQERRDVFATETRLPGGSLTDPIIVINELHYNPDGDDAEFLELYNASSQAVDLSGWVIDGVDFTIEFGTVILPGDYVVLTDNDVQFREQSPGNIFVGGQYSGGLSGGGEIISLFDADGRLVDQVEYDDSDPWPESPDGNGFSLALISPNLDNSLAESWAASTALNGTPGRANDTAAPTEPTEVRLFAAGRTAEEIIELEVNGSVVATFALSDFGATTAGYESRQFTELVWASPTAVDVEQVRVYFVNDLWLPDQRIDRNVLVDRIEIDETVYQTEASTTFSTGTFVNGQRVDPGFLQSEELHVNGYFEYLV